MFAAVVTAGMLASCSSESLTGSDPKIETPDQADLVPIEVGVATNQTKAVTRGTGSAGGTGVGADVNIWRGERVNVMMYQLTPTTLLPTFNFTKDAANNSLYENVSMVTPLLAENSASGIAKEPTNPNEIGWNTPTQYTYKVKYYPASGQSDFWGYYLGGYGTPGPDGPAGNGTLTMYEDAALATSTTTEANATCVATHVVIDGTHDLLVGQAPTIDELTTAGTTGAASAYSAKAARVTPPLQPNIIFKHLLSRLQFKVKPGKASGHGVKVNAIKVRSLTTGEMIVAYKYKNGTGAVAEPNRLVWNTSVDYTDPATTTATYYKDLTQLELKRRLTAADITAYGTLDPADPYKLANEITAADEGKMRPIYPVTLQWNTTGPGAPFGEETSVGEALLVAPQDKYEIEVDYSMDLATARNWYQGATDYHEGDLVGATSPINDNLITDLIRTSTGTGTTPLAFAPGESYLITISLYGPEEIKITTTLTAWTTSDQNIEIGAD